MSLEHIVQLNSPNEFPMPARSDKKHWKPSRAELEAAQNERLRDVIAPNLRVLLVGINPSLYSAAVGHHFARPGNRFWPALHRSGFTDRQLHPSEDMQLLEVGIGITNLVVRATARADELSRNELTSGARRLESKLKKYQPRCVAFVGITAFRAGFGDKQARVGLQAARISGCDTWVLPNPSGLNAHYQIADFTRLFAELRAFVEAE